MDSDLFLFVMNCLLIAVPKIHDAQSGTSTFMYKNIDGKTLIFASLNKDLGWRWDNFSFQDLDSC